MFIGKFQDKGLFSTANILQIADVFRRVVFMFLANSSHIFPRETSEMLRHFVLTTKTTQPRRQVFSLNCSVFWPLCCTIDIIFQILQNSSKFGRL